jgi:hypothetical protein
MAEEKRNKSAKLEETDDHPSNLLQTYTVKTSILRNKTCVRQFPLLFHMLLSKISSKNIIIPLQLFHFSGIPCLQNSKGNDFFRLRLHGF